LRVNDEYEIEFNTLKKLFIYSFVLRVNLALHYFDI